MTAGLPESLDEIAQDFGALSARDRLTMLLDFSDDLPELPERFQGHGGAARAGRRVPVTAVPRG